MTDEFPEHLDDVFSVFIGRIAAAWSAIESNIDMSIWAVAGIAPALGACVTSQIFTLDGRMRSLLALLKLRKAPASLITLVNTFADEARGPQDIRNRIIHDNWLWKQDGKTIARLEVTAPRKLRFEIVPVTLDDLKANFETIRAFAKRANKLRTAIYAALPSLPEMSPQELHPITIHQTDQ